MIDKVVFYVNSQVELDKTLDCQSILKVKDESFFNHHYYDCIKINKLPLFELLLEYEKYDKAFDNNLINFYILYQAYIVNYNNAISRIYINNYINTVFSLSS